MRVTYLAHACLLIESAGGTRLLTDPWLNGPTYLSAWWHFPAPAKTVNELGRVDAIYLTHEHADHFHPPTLRAFDRSTPIFIGQYLTRRFHHKLAALGFTDLRELPHGQPVEFHDFTLSSYQSRADDTALVVHDREATLLNLNDSLLRGAALDALLERNPHIDLLAASFANAEAYPIVYQFDDPSERPDWDDATRFDEFLQKVRHIQPTAFVPFASMFSFLAPELFPLNERIVSPQRLIERAQRGEVAALPLPMNPGDAWTPTLGHEILKPLDWSQKPALLRTTADQQAPTLRALAAAEVVPGGHEALAGAFARFFVQLFARVPAVLLRRLTLAVRFLVTGRAAQTLWMRAEGGRFTLEPPASDDAWDLSLTVGDWPLWRVLTQQETWQTLGISCRFSAHLRKQVRAREVYFWFLLYLDDLGYWNFSDLVQARALTVALRRRREFSGFARDLIRGRFIDHELRQKFAE